MTLEVVNLREKSNSIQVTPGEALKEALAYSSDVDEVVILTYKKDNGYTFWQGGSISNERVLWHLEQYKAAVLEGRLEVEDEPKV